MASEKIGPAASGVALAATGLFAGAAAFVTLVEHPAAMQHSISSFYGYFPGMYSRAAKLQGGLAFLGSHAAMIAAAKAADRDEKLLWRVSGLLLGAVWPWTVFGMMPTNKTIIKQDESDEKEQAALLARWGRLHLVRTVLSTASLAVMVGLLVTRREKK